MAEEQALCREMVKAVCNDGIDEDAATAIVGVVRVSRIAYEDRLPFG